MNQLLSLFLALSCLLLPAVAADAAKPEGLRERWGELYIVFNEPVVPRTAVENGRRLRTIERYLEEQRQRGEEPTTMPLPSAEDCGLTLFTLRSTPAGEPLPRLHWADQNSLRIEFAPGSSPSTEYHLEFTPGTTYLGGAPLATPSFSFRCKPASLYATWLEEHAGGAAMLYSTWSDTREAQALAQSHEGLRVCFRRLRHVPMVGWVCTGTVPARLRPATVADGLGGHSRMLAALLEKVKPEELRPETPLPQCLIALPQQPLVPGAHYELGVEASAGSGFESAHLSLGELPAALVPTLERELVQEAGRAAFTRLTLRFSQPVPREQLQALWERMHLKADGMTAQRQADGSYVAEVEGRAVRFRLHGLLPCSERVSHRHGGRNYHYAPAGCAQGLEMDVDSAQPLTLSLTLPADVRTRHGLALAGEQTLFASSSPAAPALTGNGSNIIPWSGQHVLQLPLVNVGEVTATAYHWDAASAARLLPVIQQGLRDDTIFCELYQRFVWMRRRADLGLSTEGWLGGDARTEAGRALRRLQKERQLTEPLREQALAAATAFEAQPLDLNRADNGNGLLEHGWAALDLDRLTGGQLRPGLYLVSLSYRPTPEARQALVSLGMQGDEPALACTVDVLVQVTDMSVRYGLDRLLVNSLTTGQPLDGGRVQLYTLPDAAAGEDEEEKRLAAARVEATPTRDVPALPLEQGEAVLPEGVSGKLLLLQRGEDYALFSLRGQSVSSRLGDSEASPMAKMFCDRPLYRPGDTAHLRGVLRCPTKGGLTLPRAKRGSLTIRKPNDEVLERREVTVDAYGAFAEDITLPAGEDDVTGSYRCCLVVQEGKDEVEAECTLRCEVFRRDAFKASVRVEAEAVAPTAYRLEVEAVDYNGTPLAGGKVELSLSSGVLLLDEAGRRPEGLKTNEEQGCIPRSYTLTQQLVLDAQGRATLRGRFGAYEEAFYFHVGGSVANDREERVKLKGVGQSFIPADFTIRVDSGQRLHLVDTRSLHSGEEERPLAREQELELVITTEEEQCCELPSGLSYTEEQERTLSRVTLTVPANCREGIDLRPYREAAGQKRGAKDEGELTLHLSGRDTEGRLIRMEHVMYPNPWPVHNTLMLQPQGRSLRIESHEAFAESGQLHAYISSQGKRRHALVAVEAGSNTATLELQPQEYGAVNLSLISCGKDSYGTYTHWEAREASCSLPRPDKELRLEFHLPAGAKPGDRVVIQGRVLNREGQGVASALTLFAVDAGMMSVGYYELPRLAEMFYRGEADSFWLNSCGEVGEPCRPLVLTLPNLWSRESGAWDEALPRAGRRSVLPAGLSFSGRRSVVGSLFRWGLENAVRNSQSTSFLPSLLGMEQRQVEATPAPAPVTVQKAAANGKKSRRAKLLSGVDGAWEADDEGEAGVAEESLSEAAEATGYRAYALAEQVAPEPRLRSNFEPVALWLASLETAADGSFRAECTLPDTLTTYKVCGVALDASGSAFGQAEGEFLVNQDLMLTAGTPFFMSTGDKLLLPLTITNNRDEAGEWSITLDGAGEVSPQQVRLEGRQTATLFFEVTAGEEGESVLRWTARSTASADAVEGRFPVRYPAPLLKETHQLVLVSGSEDGEDACATADLLADETAGATRGGIEVEYSTSPLIHLSGNVDFLLSYPYGCTEQRASALLPWMFYEQLAPFCPQMGARKAEEARAVVEQGITHILARQQQDGGLSYWATEDGAPARSCAWASAYAALVLTVAEEQGFAVDGKAMEKLRRYLGQQNWHESAYMVQYAAARARGRSGDVNRILVKALREEQRHGAPHAFNRDRTDLRFMAQLRSNPAGRHRQLLDWLRSKGRDYRHRSSWSGGWTILALSEYLRLEQQKAGAGSLFINGDEHPAAAAPARLCYQAAPGQRLADIAPTLEAGQGTVYARVKVRAQPEQTEYPGVTEKGLQVTRLYEVKNADGQWKPATEWRVGDIVRVTLTCAKMADTLEYFVLEDYLPSCMEAINPNVPGQAAGIDHGGWCAWSRWFDHKEYLADRVRGFCTRWEGRDVVNMSYYARVKRAGTSTAPPAEAQLMYEPQVYGLSGNTRVTSLPAQER